jgi:hypothetical protein
VVDRRRIGKSIRNTFTSIVVLSVLAVGAGAAYTWYMGKTSPAALVTPVEAETAPVIKHVQPATNAPIGASVQTVTSPVNPGENASITARTSPGADCTISVVYDKTASKDSGLSAKTADEFGMVSWTWTIEASAPLGKWPVKVTCALGKKSALVQADLVVAKL